MRRALGRQALQTVGHEGARTGPRSEITLRKKPLENIERGLARDAELRGEIARGRQTRAAGEAPLQDTGAQLPIDLPGEVVMPLNGNVDFHSDWLPVMSTP